MPNYEIPGDVDINRRLVGYWSLSDLKGTATDGIIAHYKMNDNAADTDVIDSKLGNTGTANINTSGLTGTGKINEALDFTRATPDFVDCGTSAKPTSQISIAFWMNAESANDFQRILGTHDNSDLNGYGIKDDQDGKLHFILDIGGVKKEVVSNDTYAIASYQGVVCTYDGAIMKMYVGGVLQTDTESVTGNIVYNSNELTLGNSPAHDRGFDGLLDDIRIYDRGLSQSEVNSINNSGSGTETTELFRDTIVAIDRGPSHNHGVISGATNTEGLRVNSSAMFFDGVDDRVDVGPDGALDILNKMSISALINLDDVSGTKTFISNRPDATDYWQFRASGDDLQFAGAVSSSGDDGTAQNILIAQKWHNVIMTFDGTTKKLNLYLDGNHVLIDDTLTINPLQVINGQSIIGTIKQNVTAEMFGGKMQNMRVYNRILTAGEASKIARLKL